MESDQSVSIVTYRRTIWCPESFIICIGLPKNHASCTDKTEAYGQDYGQPGSFSNVKAEAGREKI
jgi:hypothetical protein